MTLVEILIALYVLNVISVMALMLIPNLKIPTIQIVISLLIPGVAILLAGFALFFISVVNAIKPDIRRR